jgi:hypothetical protein
MGIDSLKLTDYNFTLGSRSDNKTDLKVVDYISESFKMTMNKEELKGLADFIYKHLENK